MNISEDQFYEIWERFATSDLIESLPDDLEDFCAEHEITLDYYLQEFM